MPQPTYYCHLWMVASSCIMSQSSNSLSVFSWTHTKVSSLHYKNPPIESVFMMWWNEFSAKSQRNPTSVYARHTQGSSENKRGPKERVSIPPVWENSLPIWPTKKRIVWISQLQTKNNAQITFGRLNLKYSPEIFIFVFSALKSVVYK